jgi:FkbM family methyltransferase
MRNFLIKYFPFLQTWWLTYKAYRDVLSSKKTYSQYGEDEYIFSLLTNKDLSNSMYIEVGANHPTAISNTYLFYKKGHTGVLVEPNSKLIRLLKRFRKRDIILPIGMGKEAGLAEFKYTISHVLNSFDETGDLPIIKTEYIPIMPLDALLESIVKTKWIFLLSIDVEGKDFEVLQGALNLLKKTHLLIIEANEGQEKIKIENFLQQNNFSKLQDSHCNMIFQNNALENTN